MSFAPRILVTFKHDADFHVTDLYLHTTQQRDLLADTLRDLVREHDIHIGDYGLDCPAIVETAIDSSTIFPRVSLDTTLWMVLAPMLEDGWTIWPVSVFGKLGAENFNPNTYRHQTKGTL